jgi:hypothetical protein
MGAQRTVVVPQKSQSQQEKDAAARTQKRRNTDRSAMASLSLLSAPVLARKADIRVGGEPFVSAAGPASADDSSSTATRTSSCASHREIEERDKAMNFAQSFIQFAKERQLM